LSYAIATLAVNALSKARAGHNGRIECVVATTQVAKRHLRQPLDARCVRLRIRSTRIHIRGMHDNGKSP